jgi:trehalose 6-phosphate phosphatase
MTDWRKRVVHRVRAASCCALFLDFDGTLAELTREPREARLSPATKRVLGRLARDRRVRLFFISGRRRVDLWKRVRLRGCQYLGLFGAESGPRSRMRRSAAMQRVRAQVLARIAGLPRVWVEDKGPAFVLHYRDASPTVRSQARRRLQAVLRATAAAHQLRSAHGLEVVPPEVRGKGDVVRQLLRLPTLNRALPIYLGDDLSDESAFRALGRGVTVRVGPGRPTAARYALRNPSDVCAFLEQLAEALR